MKDNNYVAVSEGRIRYAGHCVENGDELNGVVDDTVKDFLKYCETIVLYKFPKNLLEYIVEDFIHNGICTVAVMKRDGECDSCYNSTTDMDRLRDAAAERMRKALKSYLAEDEKHVQEVDNALMKSPDYVEKFKAIQGPTAVRTQDAYNKEINKEYSPSDLNEDSPDFKRTLLNMQKPAKTGAEMAAAEAKNGCGFFDEDATAPKPAHVNISESNYSNDGSAKKLMDIDVQLSDVPLVNKEGSTKGIQEVGDVTLSEVDKAFKDDSGKKVIDVESELLQYVIGNDSIVSGDILKRDFNSIREINQSFYLGTQNKEFFMAFFRVVKTGTDEYVIVDTNHNVYTLRGDTLEQLEFVVKRDEKTGEFTRAPKTEWGQDEMYARPGDAFPTEKMYRVFFPNGSMMFINSKKKCAKGPYNVQDTLANSGLLYANDTAEGFEQMNRRWGVPENYLGKTLLAEALFGDLTKYVKGVLSTGADNDVRVNSELYSRNAHMIGIMPEGTFDVLTFVNNALAFTNGFIDMPLSDANHINSTYRFPDYYHSVRVVLMFDEKSGTSNLQVIHHCGSGRPLRTYEEHKAMIADFVKRHKEEGVTFNIEKVGEDFKFTPVKKGERKAPSKPSPAPKQEPKKNSIVDRFKSVVGDFMK